MCLRIVSRVFLVFPSICFLVGRTVCLQLTSAQLRSTYELLGDAPSLDVFAFLSQNQLMMVDETLTFSVEHDQLYAGAAAKLERSSHIN